MCSLEGRVGTQEGFLGATRASTVARIHEVARCGRKTGSRSQLSTWELGSEPGVEDRMWLLGGLHFSLLASCVLKTLVFVGM